MAADGLGPTLDAYARQLGRAAALRYLRGEGATKCPFDPNGGLTSARMARAWTEANRDALPTLTDDPLPE
jgi:hypothetical protein